MPDLTYRGLPVALLGAEVPDVGECHTTHRPDQTCPQCDGFHDHDWVAVRVAAGFVPEMTVRCRVCGGRCCSSTADFERGSPCLGRRHHADFHVHPDGSVDPVGGFWAKT